MMKSAGILAQPVVFKAKKKVEMARNAQALTERNLVTIPHRELFPELVDELEAYEYVGGEDGATLPRMSAPSGSHDDCTAAFFLLCSFLRAGGGQGRYHRAAAQGSAPSSAPREATEVKRRGRNEVVHYDVPAPITGGFYRRDGRPIGTPKRVHTPRRRGGGLGRGLFNRE